MEGRFALIADRSQIALIAPINFFAFFQSPDDYNIRFYIGSFLTMVRLLSLLITMMLPALYIAVVSYHYEVIPYEFKLTLKGALEYVPLPPIVEAISMSIILELLAEAATRLHSCCKCSGTPTARRPWHIVDVPRVSSSTKVRIGSR